MLDDRSLAAGPPKSRYFGYILFSEHYKYFHNSQAKLIKIEKSPNQDENKTLYQIGNPIIRGSISYDLSVQFPIY